MSDESEEPGVWRGKLRVSDQVVLDGLSLETTADSEWEHGISGDTLQVLGLYNLTAVPIYLTSNALRVSCHSLELQKWLRQALAQAEETGDEATDDDTSQTSSPSAHRPQTMGILCSVNAAKAPDATSVSKKGKPVTEILLSAYFIGEMEYEYVAKRYRSGWDGMVRLDSDEREPDKADERGSVAMALYAISISSGLLYKTIRTDSTFTSNTEQLSAAARTTQKHERLSQLFDEATERRKKPRLSDGREHSASRASSAMTSPMLPQDGFSVDNILGGKGSAGDSTMSGVQATTRVPPSRSTSASMANEARPASRRGNLERTSTLLSQSFTADTALEQQIETRNKELISRTVLIGMKSYGLNSYKGSTKKSHTNVTGAESQGVVSPDVTMDVGQESQDLAGDGRDAEYKSVYHQTNKATCFAFRNGMGSMMLRPESIKDVVDRQLAIFCTEPP